MRAMGSLILVSFAIAGCQSQQPAATDPALDHLLTKINERLALMEAVARNKYRKGLPAADSAREEEMLRAIAVKAEQAGLPPTNARWFFAAQIQAAKFVQESYFRRWKEGGADAGQVEDLATLRERINQLNDELIAALGEFRKQPPARNRIEERARILIQGEAIDDAVRATAIRPLLEKD